MQNNFSIQVLRVVKSFWLTSKKIPRTMRLVILFLFCFVGLTNATDSYAQSAKVTMNVRNQTVEDVLRAIEKQTEFSFFYNNAHINLKRLVTISANRNDIFKVLDEVFKNTNVEYKVIDKKIILSTELASVEQAHQEKVKVSGRVVDAAGEPVIGASVIEKGSSNGTITDMDGNFILNVGSKDAILEISYIGYQGQSLKVTPGKTLSVVLKEDTQSLDEVVVVGFGVQKKANLTGAVSQVKMDDVLGSRPVVNAMSALQGAMPGLQITPNNDAAGPGQSKSFNIRGTTSINGGGPLVLIDNVPGDIDMLNPEDIESVSVLKDAASAAIYGARAAFGVILVTTKKAKKGDGFHVNYNNNFGFQSSINRPEQADGLEWMQAYLDGEFNAGKYYTGQDIKTWMNYLTEYRKNPGKFQTTGDGVYVDPETGLNYYLNEKDLYANMLDDYGFLQAHNVSLSGGTDKLAYRLSLGYNSEQGILITDKDRYKRLSGSAYISAEITSWLTQSVDIRYAQSDKNMPVTSDKTGLYDMRLPVVYPEGSLTLPDGTSLMTNTPSNVLRMATDNNTIRDNARILSKTVLKPLKGLEVAFEYTFDKTWSNQNVNKASIDYTTVELAKIQTATTSSLETTHQSTDYNAIKEGGDNVYGLGATLEGFDVNPLMYEFVFDQAWDYPVTTDQWITNWSMCRGGNQDANIIKAWRALHQKIYTEHATCGQSVLMNARPRLTGTKSWNTSPGIHYANNDLWQIWKELLKARNINNSDFRFDVINIGRQVLGNLFSEYRDQFTACYNRKDTTGMREWSTRMDNLLLDVDRLLSCDATLSIGKWLQDARNCGATVSEKDYYEENARCILTVWGQQDTQLNDYANRGWGGLTRSFYRERWKRFTDGVIAAVSEDKPFDEDKFHQDITQFEYNWTLQKDSFPIVSEEDPIQIADSLILKYDTYFTKAQ